MAAIRGALIIVLVAVAAWGAYLKLPELISTYNAGGVLALDVVTGVEINDNGRQITYHGKSGRTAFELLELAVDDIAVGQPASLPNPGVAYAAEPPLEQVIAINGVEAGPGQQWRFAVDGFLQHSDPRDFKTQTGQVITWTLQ